MLDLIKVIDGKPTPYNLDQFGRDYNTTGRQDKHINPHGVFRVRDAAKPEVTSTQKLVAWSLPKLVDGVWSNGYDIVEMSEAELALALVKERAAMSCPSVDGIITIGEASWDKALNYRDEESTTFAEKVLIDGATVWNRNSHNVEFIGYLIGYTDLEMDELFRKAMAMV